MYKDRSLKPYFSDFFSRKNFVKQRKQKIKRSQVKIKQRLTSVLYLRNLPKLLKFRFGFGFSFVSCFVCQFFITVF